MLSIALRTIFVACLPPRENQVSHLGSDGITGVYTGGSATSNSMKDSHDDLKVLTRVYKGSEHKRDFQPGHTVSLSLAELLCAIPAAPCHVCLYMAIVAALADVDLDDYAPGYASIHGQGSSSNSPFNRLTGSKLQVRDSMSCVCVSVFGRDRECSVSGGSDDVSPHSTVADLTAHLQLDLEFVNFNAPGADTYFDGIDYAFGVRARVYSSELNHTSAPP